jgi:hypothetical protein
VTTFLSWRVGFALEVVVIAVVLAGIRMVRDVPFTGDRQLDLVGAVLSVVGMGGIVLGILAWQEGAEAVGVLIAGGAITLALLWWWLKRRERLGQVALLDPELLRTLVFRLGITGQLLQNTALGGAMIVLPIFLQMVLGYDALQTGLALAPLSLTMFAVAMLAGRRAGRRRSSSIIRAGFALLALGILVLIPLVPRIESGLIMAPALMIAGAGLGLLVSQLNAFTLAPISQERISEAAGVNSASGSFGLSFGLALAGGVMLATLAFSFTNLADQSLVLSPEEQQQVAAGLEEDAEVMSDEQLTELLVGQPEDVQAEILRINDEARARGLQAALLVPFLAGLLGLGTAFLMVRQPDVEPSADIESVALG